MFKKIIYICIASPFPYVCETVPKWPSLMKGRGTKELEQLKSLSLKTEKAMSKSVAIIEKKGKQYFSKQIIYINQGHLPAKVTPVIDFTDKSVNQCEVPVVENTFVFRLHK